MTEEKRLIKAAETLSGQRLDVALVTAGAFSTRSQAQKSISDKKVWINGKIEKASYKVQVGDDIEFEVSAPKSIELVPYDFPLDIVFEDEHVIVVNKPAGLVVHPAYGHESDTLINALLARHTKLAPSKDTFRPGLVHRIDKGTSGLIVLAKTEQAHYHLAKQFLKKTIHRRYWALSFNNRKISDGTIETYLTRDPKNRQRFIATDSEPGKFAITHYKVLAEYSSFRLFQLQLETGRTHQIRVHLSSIGNPIVGDDTYGGKNQAKNLKSQKLKKIILEMDRFCLHAKELGFNHPETKKDMKFDAPIPEDLHETFELGGFSEFI